MTLYILFYHFEHFYFLKKHKIKKMSVLIEDIGGISFYFLTNLFFLTQFF